MEWKNIALIAAVILFGALILSAIWALQRVIIRASDLNLEAQKRIRSVIEEELSNRLSAEIREIEQHRKSL